MAYLHCPDCNRTAWLHTTAEATGRCHHCDSALTPMPAGQVRLLVRAVRERFVHDARGDVSRRRFVRD